MRLFICIDLNQERLDHVVNLSDSLREGTLKGRFVKRDHMHLTLHFLGDVEDERLPDLIEVMDKTDFKAFNIYMSGLGWFSKRRGKILWIGLERSEELTNLHDKLGRQLEIFRFQLEKREYTPHITLARDVKTQEDFNPAELGKTILGRGIHVKEIVLKKSENIDGKLVHSKIYSRKA